MNDSDSIEIAKFLDWDSAFFEKRIARVNGSVLSPERVQRINDWSTQNHIDCFYFLATSDDDQTVVCAENDNYHLVDIRVTLVVKITDQSRIDRRENSIRFANEEDIAPLRKIAGISYTNTRFFSDRHFDREKCRQLYEVWIEKCVRAQNGCVFVWDFQNQAVAYVTAAINTDRTGSIELVGVSPEWQGKGIGKKLIQAATDYFYENQVFSVTTVTQGRNIHALMLYQKCGFSIQSIELWYHKWIKNCPEK